MNTTELDLLFSRRRSVRKFKPRTISDHALEGIVDAARLAPTARNIQPWEFLVIKEKKSLEALAALASPNGSLIAGAAACLVVVCQDTKYYLEDGCAATTQALLAASGLGIGSCWIAGDKKDYAQAVISFLNVPAGYKLISLIALGYADEAPDPAKRSVKEVLHREKF
jgi:nitroreductase